MLILTLYDIFCNSLNVLARRGIIKSVKLTYETGIAAFIQFIIMSFFILITQMASSVTGCVKNGNDCITNVITSIIFFILTAVVFGIIWLIAYAAQSRRSRRLAQLVICIEGFISLIALFSIKLNLHSRTVSGTIASFGVLVMSVWIISLAFRLMRAGESRVMTPQRRRRRHTIS
jgi:cadmium resistance protein CadD (predicted permease)